MTDADVVVVVFIVVVVVVVAAVVVVVVVAPVHVVDVFGCTLSYEYLGAC